MRFFIFVILGLVSFHFFIGLIVLSLTHETNMIEKEKILLKIIDWVFFMKINLT